MISNTIAFMCFVAATVLSIVQRTQGRLILLTVPLLVIGWYFLAITWSMAADRMLILSDQNAAALRGVLDAAIRANGLSQVSRNAMIFSDMLDQAGVVTKTEEVPAKKDDPPPEPKKDDNQ